MISFVIPAHNEEALIGACVDSIHDAGCALELDYEIIVAADSCEDATARIARARGARVVEIEHRQISRVRNAGAGIATGDILFFVDGDTTVTPELVRSARRALERGAVGGGASTRFDGPVPLYANVLLELILALFRVVKVSGGCFLFVRRDAFERIGGFDETVYASEEVIFAQGLKKQGRFVILRERAVTSGRKLRTHTARELLGVVLREALRRPSRRFKSREGLDVWYGPRRADQHDEARSGVAENASTGVPSAP